MMHDTNVDTHTILNGIYRPLHERATAMTDRFRKLGFDARLGWYNMHYRETGDGRYSPDYFPIPVISVVGLCDVEINIDAVTITSKLTRSDALAKDLDGIGVPYESYGVDDWLKSFRTEETSSEQMRRAIEKRAEKEIFFGFSMSDDDPDAVAEFIRLLQKQGFYY